jgi:PhnB protein
MEQLDEAVEAILADPGAPLPSVNASIDALVRVAAELRTLPREDFKLQLKADLERRASMTRTAVSTVRQGFHTITPYLIVREATELIDFVKQAFSAEELYRGTGSAGGVHAEVKIGDSIVMLGGGGTWSGTPTPTGIHLYVEDADAVYERALQAGAVSLYHPVDQPYGDREASVKDLSGNHWYIATHKGDRFIPEGLRTVTPFLHPKGAERMIGFLKDAFGAEEESRTQSPDGVIHHATVRIGDSMIEMGEAHGEWQPMATTFYMYVDNVDSLYERAVAAGGVSQSAPADQPYGDRVAGVKDPFDNVWYIATHISDSPQ